MGKDGLADAEFAHGIGPSGVKGVTKIISIDGSGAKVPGSERPAPQPPKAEPHPPEAVDAAAVSTAEPAASPQDPAPDPEPSAPVEPEPKTPEAEPSDPTEPKPGELPKETGTQEFLRLSKKERRLRERELAIKAKEEKLDKVLAAEKEFDANPTPEAAAKLLEVHGQSYDSITKALLSKKDPEKPAIEEKIDKIEKRLSDEDEAAAQKEYQEIRSFITKQVVEVADKNKEKFGYVHSLGKYGAELVYDILEVYTLKTGKQLTYEEALSEAEKHFEGVAKQISGSDKFKKTFQPSPTPGGGGEAPSNGTGQPAIRPRTLTNAQATGAPHGEERPRSREERLKAATSLLRWTD